MTALGWFTLAQIAAGAIWAGVYIMRRPSIVPDEPAQEEYRHFIPSLLDALE